MAMNSTVVLFAIINWVILAGVVVGVIALGIYICRKDKKKQTCNACGKKIPQDANICPYCGQPMQNEK